MCSPHQANAHPHIFIDAQMDIVVNNEGAVEKLVQTWTFDALFSASAILDFDKNGNRHLDDDEHEELTKTIKSSIAEFESFQLVNRNNHRVVMRDPDPFHVDIVKGRMVITLETKPAGVLRFAQGQHYTFSLSDPTFYVAINFVEDSDLKISGLPSFCKAHIERADYDKVLSQSQTNTSEDFFLDPSATLDLATRLATRLEITC